MARRVRNKPQRVQSKGSQHPFSKADRKKCLRGRAREVPINPDGRARMRGFSVFGHHYLDHGLPNFLSPSNSLVGAGKGITADLGCVRPGTWIYGDQPAHIYSGGAWGLLEVSGSARDADRCKGW